MFDSRFARPLAGLVVLAVGLAAGGCGPSEQVVTVTGQVTYQGEPVGEGTVQFVDDATGRGAEVPLTADGAYSAALPPGNYKVLVSPPYQVDEGSGIPNPKYKKVKNIPEKYQSTATSGLSAVVAADKAKHHFALVKDK